jgi:hypothetical protein
MRREEMQRMIGKRVQLHAATDDWIRGDRYGTIVGVGRLREYVDSLSGAHTMVRPYRVKLDKSERVKRFHPDSLFFLD